MTNGSKNSTRATKSCKLQLYIILRLQHYWTNSCEWINNAYYYCYQMKTALNVYNYIHLRQTFAICTYIYDTELYSPRYSWIPHPESLSHIATHLLLLVVVLVWCQKAQGSVVSNPILVKFGTIIPRENTRRLEESESTSYFQDGAHDVISRKASSPPRVCDVIDLLFALRFLIHSTSCLFTMSNVR